MRSGVRGLCVTLAAGAVAAGAMTAAYGWVGARGTGTGSAPTGVPGAVSLSPGVVGAALYPGSTTSVSVVATNPNAGPVRVAGFALDPARGSSGFATDPAHAACATTGFAFTASDGGGPGWTVPAGGSLAITLAAAVQASPGLDDACQGATLTLYLQAT